jgi:dolichyldiphosphatase
MKVPLENTYVRYEENDKIGLIMAYITLTPIYLMVMYASIIILRRDFSTIYALAGQCVNLVANKILKRVINQPRPLEALDLSDSGMPSNHCQFMGFFCTYYAIQFLSVRLLAYRDKSLYVSALFITLGLVCYSRYYLSYHTPEQIVAGAFTGSLIGVFWVLLDALYGKAISATICSLPIVDWLGVRDFSPLQQYMSLRQHESKSV